MSESLSRILTCCWTWTKTITPRSAKRSMMLGLSKKRVSKVKVFPSWSRAHETQLTTCRQSKYLANSSSSKGRSQVSSWRNYPKRFPWSIRGSSNARKRWAIELRSANSLKCLRHKTIRKYSWPIRPSLRKVPQSIRGTSLTTATFCRRCNRGSLNDLLRIIQR